MVTQALLPWAVLHPMALGYLIWPAMFGSGPPTGIDRITTRLLQLQSRLHAILRDRRTVLIRQSLVWRSACTKAVPFSARTSIALATCPAVAAKASPTPVRIILAFVASAHRRTRIAKR